MKNIKINKISIDYSKIGNGKRNLIIIPGLSIKKVTPFEEAIKAQYSLLLNDFTIYVFDRRDDVPEDFTIEQMADDVALVMDYLEIKKSDFFGASQGGMIVQILASKYSDLVNKIVLVSSACKSNETLNKVLSTWINIAKQYNGYLLNETVSKDIHTIELFKQFKEVLLPSGNNISKEEMDSFILLAKPTIDFDISKYTKNINCPSLVIGAIGDKVTTYKASQELSEILNAELITYDENFGHAVYDEANDCPKHVYDFLIK